MQTHQTIIINSTDRLTGTNGDFTYNVPIDRSANYDHVCLIRASIPKSYYLVQEGQNTFILREGGINTTITIPVGTYNYLSFQVLIPQLLNAFSPNNWTYSVSYPNKLIEADTGKFIYQVSGNTTQPSFIFTTYVYEQFGFDRNSTNTFTSNKLLSANVINFTPETTLFLHCNIANNKQDNILQDIYDSNTPFMSNIVFECSPAGVEAESKPLLEGTSSSTSTRFWLTDENNVALALNGRNVLYTLVFYRKSDLDKVIKQLIREKFLK